MRTTARTRRTPRWLLSNSSLRIHIRPVVEEDLDNCGFVFTNGYHESAVEAQACIVASTFAP